MPALLTNPSKVAPAAPRHLGGCRLTAASSVTSNSNGTKFSPNSAGKAFGVRHFAHAAEHPKTVLMRTFVAPQPMPVDVPVITTLGIADGS